MPVVTQTIAETHLQAWIDADLAVSKGQSYSIGGRSLSRADAGLIADRIDYWQRAVNNFIIQAAGGQGRGYAVAVDPDA